jgi:hypothetical protein
VRDFLTNQNNASIPVLYKQQELTNQTNAAFGVRHLIDQSETVGVVGHTNRKAKKHQ